MRIKDVAKLAGVSTTTVSRYLNNHPYMSEDTKQKIEIAIQELDYTPSYIARSLKRKRTNLIGIIIPNIRSPYFSTLIAPIEEHVTKLGYQLFISVIMENEEKEHLYLEKFVEMQVEGILLLHETDNPTVLSYIRKMKVPIVHVGIESPASNMPAVYVDNSKAICQTTSYLLSLGHQRILFLGTDPIRFKSGRERLKGYIQAMIAKSLSVPNELVLFTDYHIDSGYNAVKETLARAIHFTAIVAVSDDLALGAMNCLIDNGHRVPEDISIVGYDGSIINEWIRPRMTSIHIPMQTVAEQAVQLLHSIIHEPDIKQKDIVLEAQFVIKDSCKQRISSNIVSD